MRRNRKGKESAKEKKEQRKINSKGKRSSKGKETAKEKKEQRKRKSKGKERA